MTESDLVRAALGGVTAGAAAGTLLLVTGRVAGVSGMIAGLVRPRPGETGWRAAFLLGLIGGAALLARLDPEALPSGAVAPLPVLLLAGLLVGVGTRLAGGCTSGHGVCGLGRISPRSLAATGVFMAVAAATVWMVRHGAGA